MAGKKKETAWYVMTKKGDFGQMASVYGIDPVVARIIRNRDIIEEKEIEMFLNASPDSMYDPRLLDGMEMATAFIQEQIMQKRKIRVIGDYDVDGICATYILSQALKFCGADVDYAIPHRMKDGYGLNQNLITEAKEDGIEVILTCDNGISAKEQIDYANSLGIKTVITDHHEVPYTETNGERQYSLPDAYAIIDPKKETCSYPFSEICGGVVAFKFSQVLLGLFEEKCGIEEIQRKLDELFVFAAIATICDVMPLRDENRILVKHGLEKLAKTKNSGLNALLSVNGLLEKKIAAFHVGFIIGPCLNASGRLDSAYRALELFECQNKDEATILALELKNLNENRKQMTQEGCEKARVEAENWIKEGNKVLVIFLPECHESIAGIIAGRIKEEYGRPTFVMTYAEGEEEGKSVLKGSGRSIEAYSMYEEMTKCSALLLKFGGHKMAAGLSLLEENLEAFRRAMNTNCMLTDSDLVEKIYIDVPMPISYVTEKLIKEMEKLEPFGTGNPKPVFAQKNLQFIRSQIMGKNRNVAKYQVRDESGKEFQMIFFGDLEDITQKLIEKDNCLSVIYYPGINEFRGNKELQFIIQDYQ